MKLNEIYEGSEDLLLELDYNQWINGNPAKTTYLKRRNNSIVLPPRFCLEEEIKSKVQKHKLFLIRSNYPENLRAEEAVSAERSFRFVAFFNDAVTKLPSRN